MADDSTPTPQLDVDQAPGWYVTDPDGNVVDSGPITEAQAAFFTGEASDTEGERR